MTETQPQPQAAQQKPQPKPQPQPKAEKPQPQPKAPEFKTDSFQAVQWNQGAAGGQHVKSNPAPAQPHHRHRKPEADTAQPSTRGRRRSDEHREGAVSVAELMARRKQQNKGDKK